MGEAASPGGWVKQPGGVGAMAADTVADQTELADFGILGPLEVSRCGRAVPLAPGIRTPSVTRVCSARRQVQAEAQLFAVLQVNLRLENEILQHRGF